MSRIAFVSIFFAIFVALQSISDLVKLHFEDISIITVISFDHPQKEIKKISIDEFIMHSIENRSSGYVFEKTYVQFFSIENSHIEPFIASIEEFLNIEMHYFIPVNPKQVGELFTLVYFNAPLSIRLEFYNNDIMKLGGYYYKTNKVLLNLILRDVPSHIKEKMING